MTGRVSLNLKKVIKPLDMYADTNEFYIAEISQKMLTRLHIDQTVRTSARIREDPTLQGNPSANNH